MNFQTAATMASLVVYVGVFWNSYLSIDFLNRGGAWIFLVLLIIAIMSWFASIMIEKCRNTLEVDSFEPRKPKVNLKMLILVMLVSGAMLIMNAAFFNGKIVIPSELLCFIAGIASTGVGILLTRIRVTKS